MAGPHFASKLGTGIKDNAWLLLIIGEILLGAVLLIVSALFYIHPNIFGTFIWMTPPQWASGMRTVGAAVLASGFFAGTLKAFQFSNIFREELVSVLYDPEQLRKRKDIEDIWKEVSKVLYDKRFPDISDAIHETVLTSYFPTQVSFYYDSIKQEVVYAPVEGMPGYYDQTEYLKLTIKAVDKKPFKIGYGVVQYKSKEDTEDTSFSVKQLQINNKDLTAAYQNLVNESLVISDTERRIGFEINFEGSETYTAIVRLKKRFALEYDNNKEFVSSKFVKRFDLTVSFPEDLTITFFGTGTAKAFDEEGSDETTLRRSYQYLLFPQQGYRMWLVKRR